jgi:hypothetical protein
MTQMLCSLDLALLEKKHRENVGDLPRPPTPRRRAPALERADAQVAELLEADKRVRAATAQLSVGPVEPAVSYTLGVTAGGRHPVRAASRCGAQVAVPMRRAGGALLGDSLYVSISGMRDGGLRWIPV